MNRLEQLWDYGVKVFGLYEFLERYHDSRANPQHRPAAIISLFMCSIAARTGSLYQIERMGKGGELDRFMRGRKKPSADTMGYALNHADVDRALTGNASMIQKARRNKVHAFGTYRGWRVCAVDGTQTYATKRPCAKAFMWAKRRLSSSGEDEFYERALAISYVGAQPRLLLAMERILPGEGEVSAAIRVLAELRLRNHRYCDILCADALYAQAPFINAVVGQNMHVLVKIKQDSYHLVRDMNGLVAGEPPQVLYGVTPIDEPVESNHGVSYDLELWDAEGFTSWEQVIRPLRCVKVRETRKVTRNGERVSETVSEYHIATTVPVALMKPQLVWEIAHRRWDIENTVFNDLKQNWGFGHCYTHDPNGIRAVYALYCIAFNLMLLFAYKNLKDAPRRGVTLKELARQILVGIETLTHPLPVPPLTAG
jgi:hypothetical protein